MLKATSSLENTATEGATTEEKLRDPNEGITGELYVGIELKVDTVSWRATWEGSGGP